MTSIASLAFVLRKICPTASCRVAIKAARFLRANPQVMARAVLNGWFRDEYKLRTMAALA
jgi:hypothetical protein